eukprot:5354226-Pleurochrysis_carterae.AAC.1
MPTDTRARDSRQYASRTSARPPVMHARTGGTRSARCEQPLLPRRTSRWVRSGGRRGGQTHRTANTR